MAPKAEDYRDILSEKRSFAHLTTQTPDGAPEVTPVWFDYDGRVVWLNMAEGRLKARSLRAGTAVALAISDPDNPFRHVQIRGRVKNVTMVGAEAHADMLARKYLGEERYPFARPGEVRVLYAIEPCAISGTGGPAVTRPSTVAPAW